MNQTVEELIRVTDIAKLSPDLFQFFLEQSLIAASGERSLLGSSEELRFPLFARIQNTGLSRRELLKYRSRNALDVGCGKTADFVDFMKTAGVNAEGIDPLIGVDERRGYLIRQGVGFDSNIPRPDLHYALVVAHSLPLIQEGLGLPDFRRTEEQTALALHVLGEGYRVLAVHGKMVIYPRIIEQEKLRKKLGWKARITDEVIPFYQKRQGPETDPKARLFKFRTIIERD